jgi:hypothetical protein
MTACGPEAAGPDAPSSQVKADSQFNPTGSLGPGQQESAYRNAYSAGASRRAAQPSLGSGPIRLTRVRFRLTRRTAAIKHLGVERFIQPRIGLKHVDMPVMREKVWRAWYRH